MQLIREHGESIKYAFGHLVAGEFPEDPHHGDSIDLARDIFDDLGLTEREVALLFLAAEHEAMTIQRHRGMA